MSKYLDDVKNIFSEYEKGDPLMTKSMQAPAADEPVQSTPERSLPINLTYKRCPCAPCDASLNAVYKEHQENLAAQAKKIEEAARTDESEANILQAINALEESFKELQKEIDREAEAEQNLEDVSMELIEISDDE